VPGCTGGKVKDPSVFVVVRKTSFVAVLVTETLDAGKALPDESLTMPVITPVPSWAREGTHIPMAISAAAMTESHPYFFCGTIPYEPLQVLCIGDSFLGSRILFLTEEISVMQAFRLLRVMADQSTLNSHPEYLSRMRAKSG
jgi:hypothetical protein